MESNSSGQVKFYFASAGSEAQRRPMFVSRTREANMQGSLAMNLARWARNGSLSFDGRGLG